MGTARNDLNPSSPDFLTAWTTTPVDYDILANDPSKGAVPGLANPSEGRPCLRIICGGVGILAVIKLDGTTVLLDAVVAGQRFDIQAKNIVGASSTATKVSVYW